MALLKEKISDAGIITNYHKIGHVCLNNNQLDIFLESYASREYREIERSADSELLSFNVTIEEEESMGIRQLCYKKIKELASWSDAEDC